MDWLLIFFVFTALAFDFLNGFHDSANVVATAIASRAMPPNTALVMTAICEFLGPFLFGVAVATTIGDEVLAPEAVTIPVALAALLSAIVWNILTWWLGIPSSSSHALIGGFVGAAIAGYGTQAIVWSGLQKVLIGLFVSPILGLLFGWLVMHLVLFFGQWMTPRANVFFKRAQWGTSLSLALAHGSNDAQKTMGIMTMGLVAFGVIPTFEVPTWVIVCLCYRHRLGHVIRRLALDPHYGRGFLSRPPHPCLFIPVRQHYGHPRRCAGRRSGQHHAGDQLHHCRRRCCPPCAHGALDARLSDRLRLVPDHPIHRIVRRIILLNPQSGLIIGSYGKYSYYYNRRDEELKKEVQFKGHVPAEAQPLHRPFDPAGQAH